MPDPRTDEQAAGPCPHGVTPKKYCEECPSETVALLTEIRDMLKTLTADVGRCPHGAIGICMYCVRDVLQR